MNHRGWPIAPHGSATLCAHVLQWDGTSRALTCQLQCSAGRSLCHCCSVPLVGMASRTVLGRSRSRAPLQPLGQSEASDNAPSSSCRRFMHRSALYRCLHAYAYVCPAVKMMLTVPAAHTVRTTCRRRSMLLPTMHLFWFGSCTHLATVIATRWTAGSLCSPILLINRSKLSSTGSLCCAVVLSQLVLYCGVYCTPLWDRRSFLCTLLLNTHLSQLDVDSVGGVHQ